MILQRTFFTILVAILAGRLLTLASGRLVESFLFDVRSSDAMTYTAVVCIVTMVSLAASWLPVVRAANIDPVRVLRQE